MGDEELSGTVKKEFKIYTYEVNDVYIDFESKGKYMKFLDNIISDSLDEEDDDFDLKDEDYLSLMMIEKM
jgi:hypothetical protein